MLSPVAPPLMTDNPYYPSTVPTPPPSASPADLPPIPEMTSFGRHLTLGKHDKNRYSDVVVIVDCLCLQ
jgi:hypothetical protein